MWDGGLNRDAGRAGQGVSWRRQRGGLLRGSVGRAQGCQPAGAGERPPSPAGRSGASLLTPSPSGCAAVSPRRVSAGMPCSAVGLGVHAAAGPMSGCPATFVSSGSTAARSWWPQQQQWPGGDRTRKGTAGVRGARPVRPGTVARHSVPRCDPSTPGFPQGLQTVRSVNQPWGSDFIHCRINLLRLPEQRTTTWVAQRRGINRFRALEACSVK